jgi:hypothetical protein
MVEDIQLPQLVPMVLVFLLHLLVDTVVNLLDT